MSTMSNAERLAHRYPGPYIVRATPYADSSDSYAMGSDPEPCGPLGGGYPYFIRQDRDFAPGETPLHLACDIQDIALANLFAAAPAMLAALKGLLQHVVYDEEGDLSRAEFDMLFASGKAAIASAEGRETEAAPCPMRGPPSALPDVCPECGARRGTGCGRAPVAVSGQ